MACSFLVTGQTGSKTCLPGCRSGETAGRRKPRLRQMPMRAPRSDRFSSARSSSRIWPVWFRRRHRRAVQPHPAAWRRIGRRNIRSISRLCCPGGEDRYGCPSGPPFVCVYPIDAVDRETLQKLENPPGFAENIAADAGDHTGETSGIERHHVPVTARAFRNAAGRCRRARSATERQDQSALAVRYRSDRGGRAGTRRNRIGNGCS